MKNVTIEELRDWLSYDPDTGDLIWKRGKYEGNQAGWINKTLGYRQVNINRKIGYAHRMIWAMVHGEWPRHFIDHVNGDKADNRLANLRLASKSENVQNTPRRRDNTTGYKGVTFSKQRQKYKAQIWLNGVNNHLGFFTCPKEAHEAYKKAAATLFGEFARFA